MTWTPINDKDNPAPRDGTVIQARRRDAGVFKIHFVAPSEVMNSEDHEQRWWTTDGEDLAGNMPTHYQLIEPPEDGRWVS